MRSMPPASSHLAESPVPAPPPMIGSPRLTIPCNLSITARRSNRGMSGTPLPNDVTEVLHERVRELWVVNIAGEPDNPARRRLAHHPFESGKKGGIGVGVVKCLARRIDERHAAFRD